MTGIISVEFVARQNKSSELEPFSKANQDQRNSHPIKGSLL